MKIRCLIVDDEELALDVLEEFINRVDFLTLEARCKNPFEALDVLKRKKIDLMFLDIQMPGLTGIQLLRNFSQLPKVIITTAYPNYAIEGFELEALDYLLKPVPFERFLKAVNRFLSTTGTGASAVSSPLHEDSRNSFFVRCEKKMINVATDDILYIESVRNYIIIHLKDGTQIKTLNTISSIEEKLPQDDFLRVHRSFIVAVKKLSSYHSGGVQIGKQFIPFGRNFKTHALSVLQTKNVKS